MPIKETNINVMSIFGALHKQASVQLSIQDTVTQMSTAKAREVALMLLECAEAAEVDKFVYDFTTKMLEGDEVLGIMMISEFRKWRSEHAN